MKTPHIFMIHGVFIVIKFFEYSMALLHESTEA
jgi:hypothetical protein